MHGAVVYLGPSLPHEEARTICPNATFLPPIRRGDLLKVQSYGVEIVCIIDGYFFQDAAVGHREILSLLRSGITVIGSSSMGALRAAELDTLGMEGVGVIYSLYRNGTLVSDDEVALVFDPENYLPLSDPLVNIRCTLWQAQKKEVISEEEADLLIRTAQSIFYPERTYDRIATILPLPVRDRLLTFIAESGVDQKRLDAIAALERVRFLLDKE
ncbi:TfuA-related McrA-glycine thioamidation protein [Methanocalculus sp.]|uniref:TfuA-related McrA-glycine thioamidation protein n=1 Tax=Methanocalculus sp. TaxID=2004547 RepID=UPI00272765B2|nr:TfuA-related McrA-glycine thioamidation protein [Methanocalculus sp.]MDO8841699.1 TfuA-related McrA-glycine thioamidation protein [Methanocalculus sp.]